MLNPMVLTNRERLARQLFHIGAIKFGQFKLKMHQAHPDAPLSPIFLNLRTKDNPKPGPLGANELGKIGIVLREKLALSRVTEFEHVAGVPNAGDPFAEALVRKYRGQPPGLLRLEKEGEGDERRIVRVKSGDFKPGDRVLLVDDLVTMRESKIEAIDVLEREGLVVSDVLVLVNRGQGGWEELKQRGVALHSVYTLDELLEFYVQEGFVKHAVWDEVKSYQSRVNEYFGQLREEERLRTGHV